jgi:hypothetical protein
MAGRKIRDRADAEACLMAAEAAGVPLTEYAQQEGIDGRSLHAWHLNLSRCRRRSPSLRLVELVPEHPPARYVVRCHGFEVEVDSSFDGPTLRRLLRVVATC